MGFPRQEYWSGLPFPSPGDLPDPGIKPASSALAGRSFTTEPPGKPFSLVLPTASHSTSREPCIIKSAGCEPQLLSFCSQNETTEWDRMTSRASGNSIGSFVDLWSLFNYFCLVLCLRRCPQGCYLVAASGGYSLVAELWLLIAWLLLLRSTGSRAGEPQCLHHMGSVVVALEHRLSICGATGLVAPQHVGFSWIREWTCVSCIGRQFPYHWATREAHRHQFWRRFLSGHNLLAALSAHLLQSMLVDSVRAFLLIAMLCYSPRKENPDFKVFFQSVFISKPHTAHTQSFCHVSLCLPGWYRFFPS